MINYKVTFLLFSFLLLISCIPAEYSKSLHSYEQAKNNHSLTQSVLALKKLATLDPEKYQAELSIAEKAQGQLIQSQKYLAQSNYYRAYLASHDSYRNFLSHENKKVLVKSGKKLLFLVKAKQFISKSYDNRPLDLAVLYKSYYSLPIDEWNLIKVNAVINQLTKSIEQLNKALRRIKSSDIEYTFLEVPQLQSGIEEQLLIVTEIRDYLSKLAKYRGAKLLLKLNHLLTDKSIKALSIFNPERAKNSVRTAFIETNETYESYGRLIENISLATNLGSRDKHSSWYQEWKFIENEVLAPEDSFLNYPLQTKYRNNKLNKYIDANAIKPPPINNNFTEVNRFYLHYPKINALIEKLMIDKGILL